MADEKLKVFIAEDEYYPMQLMKKFISGRDELEITGFTGNGREAYYMLNNNCYDLAFIDINLPGMSAIEVLDKLAEKPYIIFTTGSREYAVDAFEYGAVDYLVKPFSEQRFNIAVDRALEVFHKKRVEQSLSIGQYFKIHEKGDSYILRYSDIVYLTSNSRNTIIHTAGKDYEIHGLLKDILDKLPEVSFTRIHKQYVINNSYLKKFEHINQGRYYVYLSDSEKTVLPLGRQYIYNIRELLDLK